MILQLLDGNIWEKKEKQCPPVLIKAHHWQQAFDPTYLYTNIVKKLPIIMFYL